MKPKILLVDDREENLLVLRKILESDGVDCIEANSGQKALDMILRHDNIALALIDVQMPEMSGIELATLMRGSKRSKDIPIIFVTAHSLSDGIVFDGYENGAVDFIQKPLVAHVVRSKVNVFIELYNARLSLVEKCEQLDQMRVDAEKANAAKSQFVANISHDIRSPLSAILGYADLILKHQNLSSEEYQSYGQLIQRNGLFLTTLIDDVLSLSKIEAKRLKIREASCKLSDILDSVRDNFTELFASKGITLEFQVDENVPSIVSSDQVRIQQILNNLVSNSLKFTESGSVRISVSHHTSHLSIDVRDTGQGIPEEFQEKIFQAFESSQEEGNRHGTGLGLRISKDLAKLLGGDLELVQSEEGKGSSFRLTFDHTPFSGNYHNTDIKRQGASKESAPPHAALLHDLTTLVVDDSSDNRTIFKFFLEHFGTEVHTASDGIDCLAKFETIVPDIVLLDLQMPHMDGYETAKRLRSMGYSKPIVALSAHAMEEVKHRCQEAGFTAHISKPVSMETLRTSLLDILRPKSSRHVFQTELHP